MKFRQITKKSYKEHKGKVYDLTVEKSHSYNIDNLVVHNSGGGSLVAYAAGITNVDPLEHDLIFERFLNPERGKLPDIDTDFCVKKGWMVFDYLIKKYGKEHCCNIATFGRLQLKAVIKDVSKALGVPFEEVNMFTTSIPPEYKHVDELMENPEFRWFFDKYPEVRKHASKLEGAPRHVSQHPAGICVTPIPVTDLLPVQNAKETQEGMEPGYLSQFEKDQSEQSGVVKLDILKLKNVTEIREQLHLINTLYNKNLTEDDIPFDDPKTWELMSRGDTLGVFQMASNVAIPVLKKVKPTNLEELSAINAFIRPGASGLEEYLEGKNDNSKIRKLDPRIDRHLNSTYGAIVYQEQIMFLISELMGISFGQADLYRRALEKPNKGKNVQVVADFNNNVVRIAQERGFDPKVADLVRQLIIDNSGYGFNKSHSIAYSIITYWTAWIKANYPLVFYCQMFNGSLDQLSAFMAEATKNNVVIKPPHVSYSKYDSIIEDEGNKVIRIGMNAIKGVGPAAVDSIVKAQPYSDIDDFFSRNQLRSVNKRVIESLISVDAFQDLGIKIKPNDIPETLRGQFNIQNTNNGLVVKLPRNQVKYWYEKVIEASSVKTINKYSVPMEMIKGKYLEIYELAFEKDNTIVIPEDKLDLFELSLSQVEQYKNNRRQPKAFLKLTDNDEIKATPFRKPFIMFSQQMLEIKENKLVTYLSEVENLGYSFLPHPLEQHMHKINSFEETEDGDEITTAGIVKEIIERQTKTRKKYYWMIIQTPRENVRITLWDDQFKRYHSLVKLHNVIVVRGVKGYGGLSCNTMKQL